MTGDVPNPGWQAGLFQNGEELVSILGEDSRFKDRSSIPVS